MILIIRKLIELKSKYISTNENNKLIFNNTLGAFIVKGGALIVSFLTMPAYLEYFEDQKLLGLWFTMISVLSWILTFDLGIGNGLRNHLVPEFVKNNTEKIRKYISSAYITTFLLVGVTLLLSLFIFNYINWNRIFNISEDIISNNTLSLATWIMFLGIMLQFLMKLITSILYAMQKSALTNFLALISSLLTLIYVVFAVKTNPSNDLIVLSIARAVAVNLPLLAATLIVFYKPLKACAPKLKYFDMHYAKEIMKLGGVFFWIQIMYMILTTTNEFLITWLTKPENVVEYRIYFRLFTLIGTIFTLALTPIWSAVTKALSENNFEWIRKLFKMLSYLALLATIVEFAMIIFSQIGVNIWLGENSITINYSYAFLFAIMGSLFIWNGVVSSIANGIGELKTQSIIFTIGAIIKIPIAWVFIVYFQSWIGVIISNIITMGMYCLIQYLVLNRIIKQQIRRI